MMLSLMKKVYSSFIKKSTKIFLNCFGLFSLVNGARSVHISLLIQTRHWRHFFTGESSYGYRIFLEGNKEGKKKLDLFHFDWIRVDFVWIIMFLSAIRTHSDGNHSLQRIHWWASDVILMFDTSTFWKSWGWVHFQQILIDKLLLFHVYKSLWIKASAKCIINKNKSINRFFFLFISHFW